MFSIDHKDSVLPDEDRKGVLSGKSIYYQWKRQKFVNKNTFLLLVHHHDGLCFIFFMAGEFDFVMDILISLIFKRVKKMGVYLNSFPYNFNISESRELIPQL